MTSHTLAFVIDLIDPVITTADAASTGAAEALEYIPGAMLHGAAASAAYASGIAQDKAFDLFHEGGVRFGDGLPLADDGTVGWPVPLSVHIPKGLEAWNGGKLGPEAVDLAQSERGDTQWKVVAAPGMTNGRERVEVERATSMRTAIDPAEGRAAPSQLFAYDYIKPPQRFLTLLNADDPAMLDRAAKFLKGERILGRSRSAEFGRVRITDLGKVPHGTPGNADGAERFVWCISDLWPAGPSGQPSVLPEAAFFGAPGGRIDWSRSFAPTRRVSPYNAKWQCRGIEREVIRRGSVLCILDAPALKTGFRRIGFGQEIGCGWVFVSATAPLYALPGMGHLNGLSVTVKPDQRTVPVAKTLNAGLGRWLSKRRPSAMSVATHEMLAEIEHHYTSSKRWNGKELGPAPSQWGALRTLLESGGDIDTLLGKDGDRKEREGWNARFSDASPGTFAEWVREKRETVPPERLAILARDTRDWLKTRGRMDG